MKSCLECNSEKIIKNALVHKRGDDDLYNDLRVAVDEKPDAWIFKQRLYSEIKADVCGECGFVAFYAADPKILWTAYQNRGK